MRDLRDLSLRASDVLAVVEHARSFQEQLGRQQAPHPPLLATPRSYAKLYLRLVICARRKTKYRLCCPVPVSVVLLSSRSW